MKAKFKFWVWVINLIKKYLIHLYFTHNPVISLEIHRKYFIAPNNYRT
jgi:hypothetical protein